MDNSESKQPDSIKPGLPPAIPARESAATQPPASTEAKEAAPIGFLSPTNNVIMVMLFVLAMFLLYKFTFEEMWAILKAALGLSFVIFIHELGHFLAAKWCGVNVTTFSIGFGPPIPGCHFNWGETNYRLAVLPLGGYVQMVGQVDGDEADSGSDDDPRSYRRKTVGQRMLIISAGVIMNAILAVFCFIAVYQGPGKEHSVAVIDNVDPGAPSFADGLRTGGKFTRFGPYDDPTFTDLMQVVINSRDKEEIPITYQLPGRHAVATHLEAMLLDDGSERPKRPIIGVTAPRKLTMINKGVASSNGPYIAGTPAAAAGFEFGDVIVSMTDPDPETQWGAKTYRADLLKELPDDPRTSEPGQQRDYFEFSRRMQLLGDKKVIVVVRRGKGDKSHEVKVPVDPQFRLDLGARMKMGPVRAVRKESPADSKVLPPNAEKKLKGDVIEAVRFVDADGKTVELTGKTLDPDRLPTQLRQWSDRMDRAGKAKEGRYVTLRLARHSDKPGPDTLTVEEKLEWKTDWRFDRAAPGMRTSPMAIPELGIAYEIKAIVVEVTGQNSPFQQGDVIKNIRFDREDFPEEIPYARNLLYQAIPSLRPERGDAEGKWMSSDLEEGQWAFVSANYVELPIKYKKFFVKVKRGDAVVELEIPVELDESWPLPDRGWIFMPDMRRVRASGPVDAIGMGLKDTRNRMFEVFQNLRGMIFGRISVKNLGGPLTIAAATYRFAFMDFAEFTFFLGLISINLAVVNFLPIPVLDGGHMVFLIYEKIRGQPASEAVRIWATWAGLAMILTLMMFVLYLDVSRLFF